MVHGQGLTEPEDRWREIADELAEVLRHEARYQGRGTRTHAALRRYEEARDE